MTAAPGTSEQMKIMDFYVYLYRDPQTAEIRYVGKGHHAGNGATRAEGAMSSIGRRTPTHNAGLVSWVRNLDRAGQAPLVEVLACDSEADALAIEAALISALWGNGKLFNRIRGHHRRFRPLGLPSNLADRQYRPQLSRSDLATLGGALVVYISSKSLTMRKGTQPRANLTPADIHARIAQWWQIGALREDWMAERAGPRILLGVTGPPARRWIWGAIAIDHQRWNAAERLSGGLYSVPTRPRHTAINDRSVDFLKLRGRRLLPGAVGPAGTTDNRHFGSVRAHQFDVIPAATDH